MDRQSLIFSGAVAGGLATLLGGGLLVWRWWKTHQSGHAHKHGHNLFSNEDIVEKWMGFQYESPSEYNITFSFASENALDFPRRCAELCKKHKNDTVLSRALDVGCSVGRISFELATAFDEVVGVDTCKISIGKANLLKIKGEATYKVKIEGQITSERKAIVNPDIDRSRVKFIEADGCNLPSDIGKFGLVIVSNTLHHLPDPKAFLTNVKDLIFPAGILVITDIYHWHEMMDLPKDRWIAGYTKENGEEVRGFDGLKENLSPNFTLLEEDSMNAIVRFSPRMYNILNCHTTVWKRRMD